MKGSKAQAQEQNTWKGTDRSENRTQVLLHDSLAPNEKSLLQLALSVTTKTTTQQLSND